jgi:hypothetical protein
MNGKRLLGAALALFAGLGPVQPGLGATLAQTVWRGQFEGWLPLPSQTPDPAAAAAAGGLRGRSLVLRDGDLQGPAGLACGRAFTNRFSSKFIGSLSAARPRWRR